MKSATAIAQAAMAIGSVVGIEHFATLIPHEDDPDITGVQWNTGYAAKSVDPFAVLLGLQSRPERFQDALEQAGIEDSRVFIDLAYVPSLVGGDGHIAGGNDDVEEAAEEYWVAAFGVGGNGESVPLEETQFVRVL